MKAIIKPFDEKDLDGTWLWYIQDANGEKIAESRYIFDRTEEQCRAEIEAVRKMPPVVYKEVTQTHIVPADGETIVTEKVSPEVAEDPKQIS